MNPFRSIAQVWTSETHSCWGKAALVLFYSFVWVEILWALQIIVQPLVVFSCFDAHATASQSILAGSLMRQSNVMALALLLFYANRHGIHLWNVGTILGVFTLNTILFAGMMMTYAQLDNFNSCAPEHSTLVQIKFIFLGWILAAFICTTNETSAMIVDQAMNPGRYATAGADGTLHPALVPSYAPPTLNPIYYMQRAWTKAHSLWGKIAIVLFYAFLWLNIVTGIISAFQPLLGLPCLQAHFDAGDYLMADTYLRQLNVYSVAFFFYAKGGNGGALNVGNVLIVTVVYTLWRILYIYNFVYPLQEQSPLLETCQDDFTHLTGGSWTMIGWVCLALVMSIIDSKMAPASSSTVDERIPINSINV